MTTSKYSTVFRLKSLSALIGVALVSGMYSRPANADCTTSVNTTTCSGVSNLSAPIGTGSSTPSGTQVTLEPDAVLSIGNESAISLGDDASITLNAGSSVESAATSDKKVGNYEAGYNTIEFGSNGTLTIESGASVNSKGSADDAEAINVMGAGNTIVNKGTISAENSAAIWFQDQVVGAANTVENYGTISTVTGSPSIPGNVIGNRHDGAVHFTNYGTGVVQGNLAFGGGDDVLMLYAGSKITGNFDGGAGNNSLELNGAQGSSDTLSGDIANFQSLKKTGDGEWTLSGTLGDNGGNQPLTVEVAQGQLVLTGDNSAFNGSVTVDQNGILKAPAQSLPSDVVNNGEVNFSQTSDGTYEGVISGSGSVTKSENGTLTLTGENTYTGGTTISGGRLQLGDGGTAGSIGGDVANDGTLVFDRKDIVTFDGLISGDGSVIQQGTGTTILTGDSTYTGGTTITNGTLQLGDGHGTGSIVGNVANDGTLVFNRNDDSLIFAGEISGSGSVIQNGARSTDDQGYGMIIFTGENTYTGGTTIASGTLQLGDGGVTGSITGDVVDNGALRFFRNDDVTFEGNISGTGRVLQYGSGKVTLTGVNTYEGETIIGAGTLAVGNDSALGAAAGQITLDGGTLELTSDVTSSRLIQITNDSAIATVAGTTSTLSGTILGSKALASLGSGTLVLTGTNTYTGGTTISGGTLQLGDGGETGSIVGNVVNNGALAFNRSNDMTFAGVISGNGSVVQKGSGTTVLAGENTYSGGTTIQAGTLSISNDNALGAASGEVTLAGGTLALIDDVNSGRTINIIEGNGAIATSAGTTSTLSGSIAGSGSLISSGLVADDASGTLVLTGTNTYTGGTTITGGTLQLGDGRTTGSIVGDVKNDGKLAFNRGDDVTFSGAISGSGSVVQQGNGTTILTANNTYTGGTTIASGTLQLGSGGTAGSIQGNVANEGTLVIDRSDAVLLGGTISGTGSLVQHGGGTTILSANNTYTGNTTITGGTLQLGNGGTSGSIQGGVTNDGKLAFNRSDDITFGGVISGTGSVIQQGNGTTTLTGQNTYSGGTAIQAGTLSVGNDHALGDASGEVTLAGGTLELTGSVNSDRTITITAPAGTITTAEGTTSTLSGPIKGSGGFASGGSGTLVLTGDNTYTGGTTITSGTLQIGDGGASGSILGNVINHGHLAFDRNDVVTFGGVISGTGAVTQRGTGSATTILTGANTYTGGTTITSGTLQLGSAGSSGSITGNVTNNSRLVFNRSDTMTFGGVVSGNGAVTQLGGGTTILTGANTYSGGTMVAGGTLQLGDGGTSGSIMGDVMNHSKLAFNRSDVATFGGAIDGMGWVEQLGSGTTILTGANTYRGGTTITNGGLQLGNGGASGSIVGNVTNHGKLAFNRSDVVTFGSVISGTGAVVQQGSGTTILTGTHDYTGGTTIANGTLQLGNGAASGSIVGNVANHGRLAFNREDVMTFGGLISGTGAVTQQGNGTTILTGNNTYAGGTTIASGTLQLGDGGTTGSIYGDVTNDGKLAFNRSDAVAFAGTISGSGSVLQQGSGTTVLTSANAYTGGTTITGGTLQLGNAGTTGSIQGNVTNDGQLAFNRSDTMVFDGTISGSGSVLQAGNGTTVLNAINSYQGTTTVNAGALIVGGAAHANAALSGGGAVQVNAGATLGGYGSVTGAVTNRGTIAVANAAPGLNGNGNGNFTITGGLANNGLIQIAGNGVGNTLTSVGNYIGGTGVIALNTYLGSDGSASDQLIVQDGSTSGSTNLRISNVGGLGAYTTGNGIQVLLAEKGGQTSAGDFSLGAPVVAGPYEYTLYRGSMDGSSPDSWYLRSVSPASGPAANVPNYRPEISLYGSLAPTALEYGRSLVDSLHERVGEQEPWQDGAGDTLAMSQRRVWGRYIGANGTRAGADRGIYGNEGPRYDYRFSGMQIGADLWRRQRADGHRDMAGLTAAMGDATTTVDHYDGKSAGKGTIKGYSLGAYWTHYGPRNWYVDTSLMANWYRLRADSHRGLPEMKTDGWGLTANVEGGYPFRLNEQWVVEPQAQLTYQWVDIDTVHDGAANVRFKDVESLVGRLGVRLARSWTLDSGSKPRAITAWGRLSVLHEALGTPRTEFSSEAGYVPFRSDIRGSWTQVLVGVTGQASDDLTLYASGGYQETFSGAEASGWNGKVGLRWQW